MKLRICDGEHESIVPASLEMVEQAFAADTSVRIGTEITLADGSRWLAALALEPPAPRPGEEPLQFLLSGGSEGFGGAHAVPWLSKLPREAALWGFPLVVVLVGAVKGVGYLGQFYFMGLFAQRVVKDLRREDQFQVARADLASTLRVELAQPAVRA